ncbi:MAG TPA: phenylalanine--tRNA ligase subunit alpha [Spirochaetota bacterium]|nr:phenylalanine--tRNA ligase subunit alpha [Spirochaetota bacterium]HOK92390.1 phenylalanine--tRNA ligase subunit alpha [Spirochaetota bacterium]HPP94797.1 phenylalanine--tRNA ligase subunit alpha [Spirochaetota bacterium]HRS62996.1 phenylalanine--tRNA ligase subunit alpha [Spirochaetota bacterium]
MEQQLNTIRQEALSSIEKSKKTEEIEEIRIKVLGRKGLLTGILRSLANLSPEEKTAIGKLANEIKEEIENAIDKRLADIESSLFDEIIKSEWIDVTLNPPLSLRERRPGFIHPISKTQYEIENILTSMGFIILDGPEAESEYYNFEALNIPKHHPARDMQDTFWTEDGNLLRTHTSAIQIRGMEKLTPPFRIMAPGRVFRYEATDASHEHTFYQVEGMMVDKDISVAHLIYVMKEVLSGVFKREVKVRLRPGYFPFVEPGFELDFGCLICGGEGCRVCKNSGWIEFLGCGLVHPNVLKAGNIDPEIWSGFAFGMGLNRLIMMQAGINDIRHFMSGDIRFVQQF